MLPITAIQRWAASLPDYTVTAGILLLGAGLTAGIGLVRARDAVRQWLPGALMVGLGALSMWPAWAFGLRALSGLGLAGAGVALVFCMRGESPGSEAVPSSSAARLYLMGAMGLAAVLLFTDLGGYSGDSVLAWETTVVRRFGSAYLRGESLSHYIIRRLLWDDGVLSAGNTSLFYGAPTYALFHFIGFSTWTMRFAAVVATLLSIAVAHRLAQQFFGPVVASALAVAFALNPAVLFYGRYGSSLAGTVLAVLLAVSAAWKFLECDRSAWWRAVVCAGALYVATLQYSPARIVVLLLLGFIPAVTVLHWRRLGWQRAVGVVLIAVAACGVWRFEVAFQRQGMFLHARGEQFFDLITNPQYLDVVYGPDRVPPYLRAGAVTMRGQVELLGRTLLITVPQYLRALAPTLQLPPAGAVLAVDPPPLPLYYGPVALFILWGLVHSLRRWRSWPHLFLLLWVSAGTVPLLLTNRVDAHRMALCVIPLSCWAAFGVWEAVQVLTVAGVPAWVQHALGWALILSCTYSAVNLLYYERPQQDSPGRVLAQEVAAVSGPVSVAASGWQREAAWVDLQMLERTRQDPRRTARLLGESMVQDMRMEPDAVRPGKLMDELQHVVSSSTLVMMPAEDFPRLADMFRAKGFLVTEGGTPRYRVLRVAPATESVPRPMGG